MIRDFEQIERLNYTKIFVSMIKFMNYKTIYHNNRQRLKNRAKKRQNDFFVRQNSRRRLYRTIHEF